MATQDKLSARDYGTRKPRAEHSDGALVGYAPSAGVGTRAFPGDEDFPFVKDPPAVGQTVQWRHATKAHTSPAEPLALRATPESTYPVDVGGHRILDLTVRFYPVDQSGTLSEIVLGIFPEAGIVLPPQSHDAPVGSLSNITDDDQNTIWVPIGVVDPVLRGMQPVLPGSDTSFHPPCMAYRNIYATQLNLTGTASTSFATARPCMTTLAFDVTPYKKFRVKVAVVQPISGAVPPPLESAADLYYALER